MIWHVCSKRFKPGFDPITFENKKFVDITQQCFALLPQVNCPLIRAATGGKAAKAWSLAGF